MICPKCKNPNENNTSTCEWCGADFNPVQKAEDESGSQNTIPNNLKDIIIYNPPTVNKKKSSGRGCWIFFLILFLVGISTYIFIQKKAEREREREEEMKRHQVVEIMGLYVYPKDLGNLTYQESLEFIAIINGQETYGYSDWRLPTLKEWRLMGAEHNISKIMELDKYSYYLTSDSILDGYPKHWKYQTYSPGSERKSTTDFTARVRIIRTDK